MFSNDSALDGNLAILLSNNLFFSRLILLLKVKAISILLVLLIEDVFKLGFSVFSFGLNDCAVSNGGHIVHAIVVLGVDELVDENLICINILLSNDTAVDLAIIVDQRGSLLLFTSLDSCHGSWVGSIKFGLIYFLKVRLIINNVTLPLILKVVTDMLHVDCKLVGCVWEDLISGMRDKDFNQFDSTHESTPENLSLLECPVSLIVELFWFSHDSWERIGGENDGNTYPLDLW